MEVTIAWFWLIKLTLTFVFLYTLYVTIVKHKLKNKLYNITTMLLFILGVVNPIKLQPTTDKANIMQTKAIEQTKAVPQKVSNNEFKSSTTSVGGITKEDLK